MNRVMILGVRAAQVGSRSSKKTEARGLNLEGTFSKKLPSVVFFTITFNYDGLVRQVWKLM